MFKKVVVAALIAVIAFAQNEKLVGGYKQVDSAALAQLRNDENFSRAQSLARDSYSAERNTELGRLIGLSQQVVSGINYKMTFESQNGEFEIVVYSQPWTNTMEVLSMKPIVKQ